MSTNTDVFDDVLDPKTESQADHGVSARRKVELSKMDAPLHVLDKLGIEVPHRDFNPENEREFPTTAVFDNGTRVSLFQDVRESMDDTFGDMGLSDEEDTDVIWTVVSLADETVQLTVVGDWSKRREIPYDEFAANYEPITVTVETHQGQRESDDPEDRHSNESSTTTREIPRFGY